ncbi:unnamed protein product [Caenorhabditis bovis]|uniref:G-protein coupled receptors family 1 profile domain-containing protein n=1 Tax=Caenorhabditis bovis TaxID=2654633 RepID=A0A8S1F797_9PELO|nr:unnamed protein product [Caenorhabditis bovis]
MFISEETYKFHRIIIYSIVFVFQFIGTFGNVNLIVLTIRKKTLRSKYGLLLMILALLHQICLLYEGVCMGFGIAITFYHYEIRRNTCFYALFPYVFFHCMQTGAIWMLSVDLFLTILYPFKYRSFQIHVYFPSLFVLPVCYAIYSVIAGYTNINDDSIPMCNPPSSLAPQVTSQWYFIMLLFSIATVFFYVMAFGLLKYKVTKHNKSIRFIERKAMKALKVLIFIFLITRFVSIFIFNVLTFIGIDKDLIVLWQNYIVILAVAAYSQNGYICYMRSSEYRNLFRQQMHSLFPNITKNFNWHESLSKGAITVAAIKSTTTHDLRR